MNIQLLARNCLGVPSESTLPHEKYIYLLSVTCQWVSVSRTFIGPVETFVLFGARVLMAKKILLLDVQGIYKFLKIMRVAKTVRRTNRLRNSSDLLFKKPDLCLFVTIIFFHHWDQDIDALDKSLQRCAIVLIVQFTTIFKEEMGEMI